MSKCPHCGMIHETTCSRIKAIEYNADGSVRRIEFHVPQPLSAASIWKLSSSPTASA